LIDAKEIDRRFDLAAPAEPAVGAVLDQIRAEYKRLAYLVAACGGSDREIATAITNLEVSLYFAVGALVRPRPVS